MWLRGLGIRICGLGLQFQGLGSRVYHGDRDCHLDAAVLQLSCVHEEMLDVKFMATLQHPNRMGKTYKRPSCRSHRNQSEEIMMWQCQCAFGFLSGFVAIPTNANQSNLSHECRSV